MYLLVTILVFICIEALFANSYHLIALKLAISISYGTSLIVLSVLVWNLFSWLRINHSLNVLLYLIAISVNSLNAAITIAYLLTEYSDNPDIVRPQRSLTGAYSIINVKIGTAYVLTSVISFVLMWLATAVLLRNYSSRLAKIKFWILIVLPLAYFLGQFQPLFLYTFTDFRMTNPVTFGIIYNIVINASKPIGALLFGIAFWQTSKLINNDSVKKYLILSGYGMTLLFTSNQPLGLIFAPYPPFGLATICYMSLASYLILLGIYSSAISVANDTKLRRSINKSLTTRTNLLDKIGDAEMKQQLESMIMKETRILSTKIEHDTGIQPSLDEKELKHYIEIAIDEAKARARK